MTAPSGQRADAHTHRRTLLVDASTSGGLRLVAVVIGFVFTVLLARRLGADGAGLYLLAFNIITILATASRLGFDQVVVRSVAADRSEGRPAGVRGVVRTSTRLTAVAAVCLSLALLATAGWWATTVFGLPELTGPLRVMSLAVLPVALFELWAFALRGLARIRESQWVLFVNARAINLLGLVIMGSTWGAVGIAWVTVAGAVVTMAIAAWLLLRHTRSDGPAETVSPASLLTPGSTLFATHLLTMLNERMSLLILAAMGGSVDAGVFGTALRTAGLLSLALHAVDVAVAPTFSAMYRSGDVDGLRRLARSATRAITWTTLPPVVIVLIWKDTIMRVFGEEFVVGAVALAILIAGQCVHAITGPAMSVLVMTGRERVRLAIVAGVTPVGLALNLILIPWAGLAGAAIATALIWSLQSLLACAAVLRTHGFWLVGNPFRRDSPAPSTTAD